MSLPAFLSLAACCGAAVEAFAPSSRAPPPWRPRRPVAGAGPVADASAPATSTSRFAGGGGFGAGKSAPPKKRRDGKKPKRSKSRSAGRLGELEVVSRPNRPAADASRPTLDRFGLPVPTEEDVFPPLGPEIPRVPAAEADGGTFDGDAISDATANHLGVNLDAFDGDGRSVHEESTGTSAASRWSLKMLHEDPPVFRIDDFFTAEECASYAAMVDPESAGRDERPQAVRIASPTFSSSSLSVSRRTSTTWFCRYEGAPTLLSKARRLLDVDPSRMEEPQVVRYRTGEEFSWHYDEIPPAQLTNGGQRLATLLVYLNDLDEGRGGGTVFRDLAPPRARRKKSERGEGGSDGNRLTVRPQRGTALLFFPSYEDGTPDARTLHKGEVALDTKMIAQLWIHEREYRAGVPEGNLQADAKEGIEAEDRRLGFQ
ncbi:hypothetical protein ACHAWF_011689 [Thalassiosira exigua]